MGKAMRRLGAGLLLIAGLGGFGAYKYVNANIEPMPAQQGAKPYFRVQKTSALADVLGALESAKIIRNALAMRAYATIRRQPGLVQTGTYRIAAGMKADEILDALKAPIKQMVRLRENFWAARNGVLLEDKEVCTADEYTSLVVKPQEFAGVVKFPLPIKSLEGYLFPDTYDFAPETGAKAVIRTQLRTFERKVWAALGKPKDLDAIVRIASLVELEAKFDEDRPIIAGIIRNRLKAGMPLEIDATVLYAKQQWSIPTAADVRKTESPYNTYKYKGLPPSAICSPSPKSLQAAANPATTSYYYWVGLPDGRTLYGKTLADHQKNVVLLRDAVARQKQAEGR